MGGRACKDYSWEFSHVIHSPQSEMQPMEMAYSTEQNSVVVSNLSRFLLFVSITFVHAQSFLHLIPQESDTNSFV